MTISDKDLSGKSSTYSNWADIELRDETGDQNGLRCGFVAAALPCGLMLVAAAAGPAVAAGCAFEPQGEGRVAAVIDARTFRLQDGRESVRRRSCRSRPKSQPFVIDFM